MSTLELLQTKRSIPDLCCPSAGEVELVSRYVISPAPVLAFATTLPLLLLSEKGCGQAVMAFFQGLSPGYRHSVFPRVPVVSVLLSACACSGDQWMPQADNCWSSHQKHQYRIFPFSIVSSHLSCLLFESSSNQLQSYCECA